MRLIPSIDWKHKISFAAVSYFSFVLIKILEVTLEQNFIKCQLGLITLRSRTYKLLTERVFGDGTWWNIFTKTNEFWGSLGNFPQKKK
jgi:hypothetical protein